MRPATFTNADTGEVTRTRVLTSSACGKRLYSSKKDAKAAAKRQSKATGEDITAYHCVAPCHGWHIGHTPGWRTRARVA